MTNVVWVEQPVGTGFSQGILTATSETDVADQFLEFWENFVDTFALQDRKVFVTGESYAGYYVPYIADAMLNKNDTSVGILRSSAKRTQLTRYQYFDLEATIIYDPSTSYDVI